MEFITRASIIELSNPGVISRQLISPEISRCEKVTVTEVHLEPNAVQPRHAHDFSEQIWYALKGTGKLLLANGKEKDFWSGDVVRFEEKEIHGLQNNGSDEFVYISVTSPPINFEYAYKDKNQENKL